MALGKPKLSTKTPDSDDLNALLVEGVHDSLIKSFRSTGKTSRRFIVAAIDVDEVTDRGDGAAFAKYSLRHIEFTDEATLLEAYTARTNQPRLPGDDSAQQLDLSGLSLEEFNAEEAAKDAAFEAANPSKKAAPAE